MSSTSHQPRLVPKLRFPEFRDSYLWKSSLLGSLAEMRSGGTPLSSVPEYYDGDIPWVSIADMTKAGKYITHTDRNLTRAGLENCSAQIFPVGTVIYAMYASIGECSITEVPLCSSQAILGIRPSDILYNQYLYYYLTLLKPKVKSLGQHGTQANLNKGIVQNLKIPLPTLPEQQKIADCLSSLDALIDAQSRKVEALKTYKKGLMQRMFPREGETVPRLRFKGFEGEWEVRRLGLIARLQNGYAFKSVDYVEQGPYRIITIANVQQGFLTIESTKRIAALPSDIQQHQILRLGDILISMTGNVGRVCRVTSEGLLLNQRVGKLVPQGIDAAFFYQVLQLDKFRNSMQLKAAGGAQGNLSSGDITEFSMSGPTEYGEQLHIAETLNSLDALIAAEAQKHEALKTHKRGLMQQLFPSSEEVEA